MPWWSWLLIGLGTGAMVLWIAFCYLGAALFGGWWK